MTTKYGVFIEPGYLGTGALAAITADAAYGDASNRVNVTALKAWVPAAHHSKVRAYIAGAAKSWLFAAC